MRIRNQRSKLSCVESTPRAQAPDLGDPLALGDVTETSATPMTLAMFRELARQHRHKIGELARWVLINPRDVDALASELALPQTLDRVDGIALQRDPTRLAGKIEFHLSAHPHRVADEHASPTQIDYLGSAQTLVDA